MYSDNWLTELATHRGAIIEAPGLVFEHRHPVFTGEPCHPTTARSNALEHYDRGQRILHELRASLHAPPARPRIAILTHPSAAEFTAVHIVPGWDRIGRVTLDFPSAEEDAHSGEGIHRRFLRVLREAAADPDWSTLIVAEYDTYCRATHPPAPPLRGMRSNRFTTEAHGVYALLSPWVFDRGGVDAFLRAAPEIEPGEGHEALLDRWIGRVAARAQMLTLFLEKSHAHPPEKLPDAIAKGCEYLHPIKDAATIDRLFHAHPATV